MTDDRDEVGTLGEEAAKLLAALQERARGAGGEYAAAAAGAADGFADTVREINEHIATDGAECRYCPLCRAVAAVRATSPELREHLSAAAGSLVKAFNVAMSTDVPRAAERWAGAAEAAGPSGPDATESAPEDAGEPPG